MVCSEKELGITDESDGIILLDNDAPVGMPLADYPSAMHLDISILPNMARNANVIGIARELGALTGRELKQPKLELKTSGDSVEDSAFPLKSRFNEDRALQNKEEVRIGVGIATGKVIAGYTGTQHRATYTCVGDTVNLAARIESHTKVAGQPVLIDQYTRDGLSADIPLTDLGEVIFKGKEQAICIFAVNT